MEANKPLSIKIRLAAEEALSARFGGRVHIAAETHNFWPSYVFRCELIQSPRGAAPETVILRIPREGTVRLGRTGLHKEQAALEYLSAIGSSLAPRFLVGCGDAGFVITEDLGPSPSLLDLLLGDNSQAARQGVIAFARGLGMLHAQTAGQPESLRPALPIVHITVADHWRQVKDAVAQLNLPTPQGVDEEVEAVARLLTQPGDCIALSNGDMSVVNCKIRSGGAQFFDFEESCFRHAFVDAAILRYPYPTGGLPWRLPHDVALPMELAYRSELGRVCAFAQDDNHYEHGITAACAAWTIIRMARLPKVDAGPDQDSWLLLPPEWSWPIPIRSRRRQLLAILETCLDSLGRAGSFSSFAAWGECLINALRERWPEAAEELPMYPAFDTHQI